MMTKMDGGNYCITVRHGSNSTRTDDAGQGDANSGTAS